MLRTALLLFSAAALLSQETAEKFTVDGTVVNAITGEPVKRARVALQPLGGRGPGAIGSNVPQMAAALSVSADANGHFAFSNVQAGSYFLRAERIGFVPQMYQQTRPNLPAKPLVVGPGQSAHDLIFKLTPHAVVVGKVLDENGDPMMGVMVTAMQPTIQLGRRHMQQTGMTSTNDLGEYRIANLMPGPYYVGASYRRGGPMMYMGPRPPGLADSGETSYAPVWYPGTAEIDSASPLELTGGREMKIDFTLAPTRAVHVRGVISNPGGSRGMNINLVRKGEARLGPPIPSSYSADKGTFEIAGVTPGSYILTVDSFDNNARLHGRQPVEVGSVDVEGVTLTLSPGIELTGTVRVEGSDNPAVGNMNLILNPADSLVFRGNFGAQPKADGTFSITELLPGSYTLRVNSRNTLYLKSATLNNENVVDGPFSISSGGNLEIVLSGNAAEVDGTVSAGDQPASQAAVIAVGKSGAAKAEPQITLTDVSGNFKMRGLAPGDYRLYAFPQLDAVEYANPEAMQKYESSGEPVSLQEKDVKSIQLKVIAVGAR